MGFIENLPKFGRCERCGRTGKDDDGNLESGYELKEVNGKWLCQLCINELTDKVHDDEVNARIREDIKFRSNMGMTNVS